MLNETYPDWSVQYLRQGRQEGRVEGLIEGKAEVLLRQLTRRFGPLPEDVTARVKSGATEQLDLWIDRVLDAPSLEAVFEGH